MYKKVTIDCLPNIVFAHRYTTTDYKISFTPRKNLIEIAYIEEGDIIKKYENGKTVTIPEHSVDVNIYDKNVLASSNAPVHSHFTVCISLDAEPESVSEQEIAKLNKAKRERIDTNKMYAIIPSFFLPNQDGGKIQSIIQKIIREHATSEGSKNTLCTGLVFELLYEITCECTKNAYVQNNVVPSGVMYTQQAMKYISSHTSEKIRVSDIAKHIGISEGYLSNIFKAVTGQTIIEYIIRVKLNCIKGYLLNENYTLKKAGENVGIYDENYLSKIFKKYTGMTVREYKAQLRR